MNCRRVAHDWTELEEGELPFWRRLGLRAHLVICPACKAYTKQMRTTVATLEKVDEPLGDEASRDLAARLMHARKK